jgi:hypothetical protein
MPASFIALRLAARQRGFLILGSPGTETPPSNYADESAVSDRSMSNNYSRSLAPEYATRIHTVPVTASSNAWRFNFKGQSSATFEYFAATSNQPVAGELLFRP